MKFPITIIFLVIELYYSMRIVNEMIPVLKEMKRKTLIYFAVEEVASDVYKDVRKHEIIVAVVIFCKAVINLSNQNNLTLMPNCIERVQTKWKLTVRKKQ